MTALKVLILVLAVGGLLLWAASVLPSYPIFAVDTVPNEPLIASPLPATEDGRTILTGIVIYDRDVTPNVPYILYRLQDGEPRTKQLIFRNERGCSPSAGDIPCANGDPASFPDLLEGTSIRVVGVINGDQILVEGIY